MKFEHDTVLQEYGVDRKPDIRQFHKLPGIHKEPNCYVCKAIVLTSEDSFREFIHQEIEFVIG